MLRTVMLFAVIALFLLGPDRPAHAETHHTCKGFIDSLPATISTQGVWCLRKDLSNAMTSGSAITVNANNVTLDCNGFKIGGLAAGPGTLANSISANGRFNLTVRHCNIRGFLRGIYATSGGAHLVERNGLDSNTLSAIAIFGPGSTIRGNRVVDTGGTTAPLYIYTAGIYAGNGIDIIDNTVTGVVGPGNGTTATTYGIRTQFNGNGSVTANRVRDLVPAGGGTVRGILNSSSGRLVVRDNDVQDSGHANGVGVSCTSNQSTARGNVVSGFATGISNCALSGNYVNAN
ncbi:right-handed parallel beta-helix repeat-containing protein [Marilutibacter alkalisoli]|uniref:Right-handed parallel beta-helix repeat-containing protein n=1 Tax=Marilutibacter alkalisoli TaxID=2591633 RepID=A0A514BVK8_9GAMM|nr:right-handed parallel beta-helix repeat-containing protein [Lysobacter alkalisoli]QDH71410.1 hypothetical protein FKV23_15905 [Lysobacter alkalisoli]